MVKSVWKNIKQVFDSSENDVKLEIASNDVNDVNKKLEVEDESILGQVLTNIDKANINNMVDIFGKKNIIEKNSVLKKDYPGYKLFVANDIFGGLFVINNGDFDDNKRHIWYFAPDTLQWEDLNIDYSEFIEWINTKNLLEFYSPFMWENSDELIKELGENKAILTYPYLWSKEYKSETAKRSIVPLYELININLEYQKKFNN